MRFESKGVQREKNAFCKLESLFLFLWFFLYSFSFALQRWFQFAWGGAPVHFKSLKMKQIWWRYLHFKDGFTLLEVALPYILNHSKWSKYDEGINKCSVRGRRLVIGRSTLRAFYLGTNGEPFMVGSRGFLF